MKTSIGPPFESFRAPPAPALQLALALAWTWAFWGAAAVAAARVGSRSPLIFVMLFAGGLGPALTASVLVARGRSRQTLSAFWRGVLDPRAIPAAWYAAIVSIAVLPVLAGRLLAGPGVTAPTPAPMVGVLVVGLLTAASEEPGWRGYAQDGLQRRLPVAGAALLVGMVWAVWHLPLFFIDGTFQHALGLGSAGSWWYFGSVVVVSVLYGWVYAGTGASTMAVVLLHAGHNVAVALWSAPQSRHIETAVVVGIAVMVCGVDRTRMLARCPAPEDRRIEMYRGRGSVSSC